MTVVFRCWPRLAIPGMNHSSAFHGEMNWEISGVPGANFAHLEASARAFRPFDRRHPGTVDLNQITSPG